MERIATELEPTSSDAQSFIINKSFICSAFYIDPLAAWKEQLCDRINKVAGCWAGGFGGDAIMEMPPILK
jgi:hypothetical protein